MISNTDLSEINSEYFQIIDCNDARVVLRSRSTGHYRCLLEPHTNRCWSFQIQHRHGGSRPYHVQKQRPSIEACCEYIRSHDLFHLERERERKEQQAHAVERRKGLRLTEHLL